MPHSLLHGRLPPAPPVATRHIWAGRGACRVGQAGQESTAQRHSIWNSHSGPMGSVAVMGQVHLWGSYSGLGGCEVRALAMSSCDASGLLAQIQAGPQSSMSACPDHSAGENASLPVTAGSSPWWKQESTPGHVCGGLGLRHLHSFLRNHSYTVLRMSEGLAS